MKEDRWPTTPDQLRTFLAVAQSLSFTGGGTARHPPADVSQTCAQTRDGGRSAAVRPRHPVRHADADGEADGRVARTILPRTRAVGYFTGSALRGPAALRRHRDLALTPCADPGGTSQLYPRIDLD